MELPCIPSGTQGRAGRAAQRAISCCQRAKARHAAGLAELMAQWPGCRWGGRSRCAVGAVSKLSDQPGLVRPWLATAGLWPCRPQTAA
eukprot:366238-Chlamydomonas_euryale.AAC.15